MSTQNQTPRTPTLAQVLECFEELWPDSLAEGWDATGLVTGRPDQPVGRIHFAVDPVQDVVDEADFCLEIPQFGTKHSLNVSVSVGVILWHFRLFLNL